MDKAIRIRKATKGDIPDIIRLRQAMFETMGEVDQAKLNVASQASAERLACGLDTGDIHMWLAVTESDWAVASAGLTIDQHLPSPRNLSGKIAYVMSVFTCADYRRQGLARKLMQIVLQWVNEHGITKVALHASDEGAALYQMLGFKPTTEMQLDLAHEKSQ